ncbi:glycoside hydrolase family 73 protein [Lysinibacillus xylanilyticus]|uniref:glycoside hydrolase family 73 protein n=1 Tax=Lysinibacillus xylanilyticus TaxID=582475 RepID=UPI003CFDAD56
MAADITPFIKDAQKLEAQTGIPASITLAQIILESSGKNPGGLSGLAYNAKNLFGVKGRGDAGTYLTATSEFRNGKMQTEQWGFKKYSSYYQSMYDHAVVLSKPRYQKHLQNAKTVNDFAYGIKAGGYATDPQYAPKLLKIIGSYNLAQYDSGKYKYNPISGGSVGSGAAASGDGGAAVPTNDNNMVQTIFFNVSRVGILLILFILMVIFFLRAFPVMDSVTDIIPQTKVLKGVKKLK